MGTETKKTNRELDETKPTVPKQRIKQNYRYITVALTEYQHDQVTELCKVGVTRSPTDFGRVAIIDKIRINKHLLPERKIPPKQKSTYTPSQTKKAKKHRKDLGLD